MTPEEINKKANEAYPIIKRDVGEGKYVPIDNYKKERSGYVKALEEISALPTIKGWVAREKPIEIDASEPKTIINRLVFFKDKPTRGMVGWFNGGPTMLSSPLFHDFFDMFSDLKWEDEPIEVELPIIQK